MIKYVFKRLGYMLLVVLILSFLMYMVYNMIPVDRAAADARAEIQANRQANLDYDELYAKYQKIYGTDGNLFIRYLRWMGLYPFSGVNEGDADYYRGLAQGYLGRSYTRAEDVVDVIMPPMGNTVFINIFATIAGLAICIPLGIVCAVKKGSKMDTGVQVFTVIGYSLPVFVIAILFIWIFVSILGWFPAGGMSTIGKIFDNPWDAFWDKMYHLALPLIVMTFCSLGGLTRYVRASMIEALSMDCIRTARAKGVREKTVIYSHAFRNALIPIVTLVIGWFLSIFSGSIMIENIFGLNGVGRLYIECLNKSDFEVVLALQMFYVIISLLGNLVTDIVYGLVDPRIRVNA